MIGVQKCKRCKLDVKSNMREINSGITTLALNQFKSTLESSYMS